MHEHIVIHHSLQWRNNKLKHIALDKKSAVRKCKWVISLKGTVRRRHVQFDKVP